MFKSIQFVAIFFTGLLVSSTLFAEQASTELAKLLAPVTAFSANFSQQVNDEDGSTIDSSSGEIHVQQPSNIRWLATEPFEQLILGNGEYLWQYDADLEQATRYQYIRGQHDIPSLLLSGSVASIEADYDVAFIAQQQLAAVPSLGDTKISKSSAAAEDLQGFSLTPKSASSLFDQLFIYFNAGKISGLRFIDSFQQDTHIRFSELQLNPKLDPAQFEFLAPAGIDVIIDG